MKTKTLCILANSVKNQQSCVAGIEIEKNSDGQWQNTGSWVRPISHRQNGAISDSESYLRNQKKKPELFDIVEIPLLKPAHVEGQPEDWLIDPSADWQYHGHFDPQKSVNAFLEEPDHLWLQQNGKRDRVTPEWVAEHELPSLYLIAPEQMKIYVHVADYGTGPRRSRRASFRYKGVDYDWGMTDPAASTKHFPDYGTRESGLHNGVLLDCAAICVSLAPAWKGDLASQAYHYKLIAGIIEKE
jgi:hypothetical protein